MEEICIIQLLFKMRALEAQFLAWDSYLHA